jgi:hypothetical protein
MIIGRRPGRLTGRCLATTEYHRIAPIAAGPDPKAAFARLRGVVAAMPGADGGLRAQPLHGPAAH